jgi:hypothetical protein
MFPVKKYKFNMLVEQPQNTIMDSCKRQIKIYLNNSLIVIKLGVLCWSICVLFKLNATDTWKAIYYGHRKKLIKILKNYAQQSSCLKPADSLQSTQELATLSCGVYLKFPCTN